MTAEKPEVPPCRFKGNEKTAAVMRQFFEGYYVKR